MKFHTIWALDKYEDDWSMVDAWSDMNVEENYDGFKEVVDKARAEESYLDVRIIDVTVPMGEIRKALAVPTVKATKAEAGRVS